MLKSYEFIIRVDGVAYELPTGFSFKRDIKLMGSSFEVTLVDPTLELLKAFRPGLECEIEIDGRIIAVAHFDAVSINDTNGHVYTYIGRDRAGDLVDCSAVFSNGGFERSNIKLEEAVKDVLKPFNMPLTISGDTGKAFDKVSITPGDTVFSFIDQLCKYRSLFPLSDGVGGLVITDVSDIRSGGHLTEGENVKTRTGMIDHRERFSEITIKGQADAAQHASADAETLSGSQGKAFDSGITRHRPLIIQAEREGFDLDMKSRAEWEVRHRRFNGTRVTYTVVGCEAAEGEFWKINTLVPVKDPKLGLARDMLISGLTILRDEQGTTSQVSVAASEAYDVPATREPEDNSIWGGDA